MTFNSNIPFDTLIIRELYLGKHNSKVLLNPNIVKGVSAGTKNSKDHKGKRVMLYNFEIPGKNLYGFMLNLSKYLQTKEYQEIFKLRNNISKVRLDRDILEYWESYKDSYHLFKIISHYALGDLGRNACDCSELIASHILPIVKMKGLYKLYTERHENGLLEDISIEADATLEELFDEI